MRAFLFSALVCVTGVSVPAVAFGARLDIQLVVLLRALAYDEALPSRAGEEMTIGIVFRPDDPDSRAQTETVLQTLGQLARLKIQGLRIRAVAVPFAGTDSLQRAIGEHALDSVFVASGLEASIGMIVGLTRAARIVSMSVNESYATAGVSLSALDAGGTDKARLVVRVEASRQEGMRLAPELLRVVEKIE